MDKSGPLKNLQKMFDQGESSGQGSRLLVKHGQETIRSNKQPLRDEAIAEFENKIPEPFSKLDGDRAPFRSTRDHSPSWSKQFQAETAVNASINHGLSETALEKRKAVEYTDPWVEEFNNQSSSDSVSVGKGKGKATELKPVDRKKISEDGIDFLKNIFSSYKNLSQRNFLAELKKHFGVGGETSQLVEHLSPEEITKVVSNFSFSDFVTNAVDDSPNIRKEKAQNYEFDIFDRPEETKTFHRVLLTFCHLAKHLTKKGESGTKAAGQILAHIYSKPDAFDSLFIQKQDHTFDFAFEIACEIASLNKEHSSSAVNNIFACQDHCQKTLKEFTDPSIDPNHPLYSHLVWIKMEGCSPVHLRSIPSGIFYNKAAEMIKLLSFYEEEKDKQQNVAVLKKRWLISDFRVAFVSV